MKYFKYIYLLLILFIACDVKAPKQNNIFYKPTEASYKRCSEIKQLIHETCIQIELTYKEHPETAELLKMQVRALIINYNAYKKFMSQDDWNSDLPFILHENSYSCLRK